MGARVTGWLCPRCGSTTRVVDTRRAHRDNCTRRRRLCDTCDFRETTVEIPVQAAMTTIVTMTTAGVEVRRWEHNLWGGIR